MLMTEAVTLLMATGSAGKSSISLALAAHLSVGLDFAGYTSRKACKTIVYNGEDDLEEQSRRLVAICMEYGLDYSVVKQNIMLLSNRQVKLDLVVVDRGRPIRNDAIVNHLIQEASNPDVGLLILDPLVKIHKCDESDNVHMDFVMETLTDIAHDAKVSVLALHHTSKGGNGSKQEDRIGNMDIGRGASSIVNASRIAFTLLNASAQDAEDYGMADDERMKWVRMDDAKMNLALSSSQATWFHKEGVKIPSLDVVGVLKHDVLEKSREHIQLRIARTLANTMTATGAGSITLPRVCAIIRAEVAPWANKQDADIKKRVEALFATPYAVDGKTLSVERDMNDKKKESVLLVMR
jgi:RecA-family ATPase